MRRTSPGIALVLCYCLFLGGCTNPTPSADGDGEQTHPAPQIIRSLGRFHINDGKEILVIRSVMPGTVSYRLGESEDLEGLGLGIINNPSLPWFLHNASDGSVWCYVDEFGLTQWIHDEGTGWKPTTYDDNERSAVSGFPQVVYENLPPEMQARWKPFRTPD